MRAERFTWWRKGIARLTATNVAFVLLSSCVFTGAFVTILDGSATSDGLPIPQAPAAEGGAQTVNGGPTLPGSTDGGDPGCPEAGPAPEICPPVELP